jgi:hypothetical protein
MRRLEPGNFSAPPSREKSGEIALLERFVLYPLESVKICGHLFLNCTKNTELTRAHFARTVSFAFINREIVPAA